MATIYCPGCREPLDPSQTQCGICLRTLSAREIARLLREQSPEFRRRKFLRSAALRLGLIGAAILVFAVVGTRRGWIPKGRLYQRIARILNKPKVKPQPAPKPAPPPAPPYVPPAPLPAHEMPPPPDPTPPPAGRQQVRYKINAQGFIDIGPNKPTRTADPLPARTKPEPPAAGAKPVDERWPVRGKIYDLLTLKPVAGVRVQFEARGSGRMHIVRTDARGAYALKLPPSRPGYDVSIQHPLYGSVYMEDGSPPYAARSIERRREERDMLYSAEIVHLPLMLEGERRQIRHDLVVASP